MSKTKPIKLINTIVFTASIIALFFALIGYFGNDELKTAKAYDNVINFQGLLRTPAGENVSDGNYQIVFRIYNSQTGGSALWSETHGSVYVHDGIFNVNLGETNPINLDFSNSVYYLGIRVGSDSEMTPRAKIGGTVYSLNSEKLGGYLESEITLDFVAERGAITDEDIVMQASLRVNGLLRANGQVFLGDGGDTISVSGTTISITSNGTNSIKFDDSDGITFSDSRITNAIPLSLTADTAAFNAAFGVGDRGIVDALISLSGGVGGQWTITGTVLHPTVLTNDVSIGGDTLASALSVDVDQNTLRIGDGSTTNSTLNMYSANGSTGAISYVDSDAFSISGSSLIYNGTLGTWTFAAADSALTQTGTGQVTFSGNVDATNGLDVTGASFTVNGNFSITTAGVINQSANQQVTLTGNLDANNGIDIAGANLTMGGNSITGLGANITANGALTVGTGDQLTLGDGGDKIYINSSDWDISTTGDMTGIGNITADGNLDFTGAHILGASPLVFEGATDNGVFSTFVITDPTGVGNTITFQDASGTVAYLTDIPAGAGLWTDANPGDDYIYPTPAYSNNIGITSGIMSIGTTPVAGRSLNIANSSDNGYGIYTAMTGGSVSAIFGESIKGGTSNTGVSGRAGGTSSGSQNASHYGIYGVANGIRTELATVINYGVYGMASGGSTNWAGYFADGNVYIDNNLGIGNATPAYDLDITAGSTRAINVSSSIANGYGGYFTQSGAGTNSYGVYGASTGSATNRYGGYFASTSASAGTNYGLYANASGGTTNWAGYFDGKVGILDTISNYTQKSSFSVNATNIASDGGTDYVAGASISLTSATNSGLVGLVVDTRHTANATTDVIGIWSTVTALSADTHTHAVYGLITSDSDNSGWDAALMGHVIANKYHDVDNKAMGVDGVLGVNLSSNFNLDQENHWIGTEGRLVWNQPENYYINNTSINNIIGEGVRGDIDVRGDLRNAKVVGVRGFVNNGYATLTNVAGVGVFGDVISASTFNYGVHGKSAGSITDYGGYFEATDTHGTTNYGVYATASGATTNWAGYFSGNVALGGTSVASKLYLYEPTGNGTNYTSFVAQAQAADINYTLPSVNGSAGSVLSNNGSGTLSWTSTPTISVPLNSITAATGTNTINNASHAQTWQWNSLTTQTGLTLSSTSATSGTVLSVSSVANSNSVDNITGIYSYLDYREAGVDKIGSAIRGVAEIGVGNGVANAQPAGVVGWGIDNSANTTSPVGVWGYASGDGSDTPYGVYGDASGGATAYGVYGMAHDAITNWAGYFGEGNVNVANDFYMNEVATIYSDRDANLRYLGINVEHSDTYPLYVSGQGYITTYLGVGDTPNSSYGIRSTNTTNDGYGGYFTQSGAGTNSYGVYGVSTGAATNRYGGYFASTSFSAGTNYGLYANASGGTTNWAGYFNGNVYIANNVGLNTTGPDRRLDILDASNPQMRLTYTDNSVYTDFQTNASGNLIINPTGDSVIFGATSNAISLIPAEHNTAGYTVGTSAARWKTGYFVDGVVTGASSTTYADASIEAPSGLSVTNGASETLASFSSAGVVILPGVLTTNVEDLQVNIDSRDGTLGVRVSASRFKQNITDMEDVSWIYDLTPRNFEYKNDPGTKRYGLIAEEVAKVNNLFAAYDAEGKILTVRYENFITPMIKAIQEQRMMIDENGNVSSVLTNRLNTAEKDIATNKKGVDDNSLQYSLLSNQVMDIMSRVIGIENSLAVSTDVGELVGDFADDWNKIFSLDPKLFQTSSGRQSIGYLMSQLESLGLINLISYNSNGEAVGIDYNKLPIYLLEIDKAQTSSIGDMVSRIENLENQLGINGSDNVINGDFTVLGAITTNSISNVNNKWSLDENGNLFVKSISTEEIKIYEKPNGSTGSGIVEKGYKELEVENLSVLDTTKVVVTFENDYAPATRYWIEKDPPNGFTIKFDVAVGDDVKFNYFLIQ